jgi:hypothetical protein
MTRLFFVLKNFSWAFAVIMAAMSILSSSKAQPHTASPGYTSSFSLQGRNIPLPEGEWRQVAASTSMRGAGNGRNASVALLRISSGRVTGLITVSTSIEVSGSFAGWTPEAECQRTDIHAVQIISDFQRDRNCWSLNHVVMTRGNNASAFINTYYDAAAAAGGFPPTMLRITSRKSDEYHFVTVQYYFTPDPARFPSSDADWRSNPWHRDRLDANRAAYVSALRTWAATAHASVVAGFKGGRVSALTSP